MLSKRAIHAYLFLRLPFPSKDLSHKENTMLHAKISIGFIIYYMCVRVCVHSFVYANDCMYLLVMQLCITIIFIIIKGIGFCSGTYQHINANAICERAVAEKGKRKIHQLTTQ